MKTTPTLVALLLSIATTANAQGYALRKPVMPPAQSFIEAPCTLGSEKCEKMIAYKEQTEEARSAGNLAPLAAKAIGQLQAMARATLYAAAVRNSGLVEVGTRSNPLNYMNVTALFGGEPHFTAAGAGFSGWTLTYTATPHANVWLNWDTWETFTAPAADGYFENSAVIANVVRNISATVRASVTNAGVCALIAETAVSGVTCSGGTASASESLFEAVKSSEPSMVPVSLPTLIPYPY